MRAVITLLQKEYLRLTDLSIEAHRLGMVELYEDIDQVMAGILEAIKILKDGIH
ncbi:MAG: hypothetical protein WC238_04740 [Parcubacteria group bacterium]|jgi:hypothetical protein